MATNCSPNWGSYVLNQFPSIVMFDIERFYLSASGVIQVHHGPLVNSFPNDSILDRSKLKEFADEHFRFDENNRRFSKRV